MEMHESGKRVYLKTPLMKDSAALAAMASDPKVASLVADEGEFPFPYRMENARYFIKYAKAARAERLEYHFGVFLENERRLIGMAGIYLIDREQKTGRIGFWLNPGYWGVGYAHEAVAILLDFAFGKMGLDSVYAVTFGSNERSRALLSRLGFRHTATEASGLVYLMERQGWEKMRKNI
jgi:RimJ/RimL family protein N-acetyltransferase